VGFDDEVAGCRVEFYAENLRSPEMAEGKCQQEAEDVNHALQNTLRQVRSLESQCAIFGFAPKNLMVFSKMAIQAVENEVLIFARRKLLTMISRSDYCGDGHSCPGD
jgi:hypothetical protein